MHGKPRKAGAGLDTNSGKGWVTARYGVLPRSTGERACAAGFRRKQGGRTQEIQRLIGRSLRSSSTLMQALGEQQITIDCDVLQTRWRHAHRLDHRRVDRAA